MVFDLTPPPGNLPSATSPQADRVSALMTWLESPIGPGLEALQTSLENVLNNNYGTLPNQPPSQRQDRNEKILLGAVWAEVKDRLNQSLHNAVLLTLGKAEQRHQVGRPWDSQLRTASQASQPLPPETPIAAVFDRKDINGRLLILGNPGAGKTTTLLDLAAALVQRANSDPSQPIPVLFNLSSWQDDKQSLKDWLLGELKLKYGVSPKLGAKWLEARTLLPLLDGLDELPPHRQEPAVQRINDWLQSGEGASQLVVCSRREEYELYATKLSLNGAICLEPLTEAQLATYFATLGMEPLWDTVRHDPDFLALVRTPLLLSVSILANEAIDPAQWQRLTTAQARLDYLLDAYIQRQLHAPIASRTYLPQKQPTPQQTRHWLTWLAQQLQDESEDEFLIERMQPSMLGKIAQKKLYKLTGWLICALIFGIIFGLTRLLITGLVKDLVYGFNYGLIAGLMVGLIAGNYPIEPIEGLDFSLSRIIRKGFFLEIKLGLTIGLVVGLNFGVFLISPVIIYYLLSESFYLWLVSFDTLIFVLMFSLIVGLLGGSIIGVLGGSLLGLIYGLTNALRADVLIPLKPNQGVLKTVQNILPLTLISYPVSVILSLGLQVLRSSTPLFPFDWQRALLEGIAYALLIGGSYGGWTACIQHFSLRLVLHRTNAIPWNYARFLNYCTERLLLQRVGGRYRFIHRLVQERFAVTGHRP